MRRLKTALLAIAILLIPVVAGAGVAQATAFKTGDEVKVGKAEKIDHTLFIAGNDVTVEANVDGDIFCGGKTVTINGNVTGDVICAGQNVRINGTIDGNIRVAGMDVVLNGRVGKSASVASQSFTMDSKALVGRDLTVVGASSTINGTVKRDIVVTNDQSQVNGRVGRDISAAVEMLSLGSNAYVAGNVHVHGYKDAQRAESAKVLGTIERHDPPQAEAHQMQQASFATRAMDFMMTLLMTLLAGIVFAALFPRMLAGIAAHTMQKPGITALTGAVAMIIVPIIVIISMLTVVGLLLGGILLAGFILTMLVGAPLFGYLVGHLTLRTRPTALHPILTMTVGIVILNVLYVIPFVNAVAYIVTFVFALGMVLQALVRYNFASQTPKAKLATAKKA